MKHFKWLIVLILMVTLVGCSSVQKTPTVSETPGPIDGLVNANFSFKVRTMNINYSLVEQKKVDEKLCYIVIEITELPGDINALVIAVIQVGDFITMIEKYGNDPKTDYMLDVSHCDYDDLPNLGYALDALYCEWDDIESVKEWFPGKVRAEIYTEDGFVVERMRFTGPKTFNTKVVHVKGNREQ